MTIESEIYVYLLDEGTDVWRPVQAQSLGNEQYRIVSPNPDPEDENWQFKTGEIVRCVQKTLSGGMRLVAVERIEKTEIAEPPAAPYRGKPASGAP